VTVAPRLQESSVLCHCLVALSEMRVDLRLSQRRERPQWNLRPRSVAEGRELAQRVVVSAKRREQLGPQESFVRAADERNHDDVALRVLRFECLQQMERVFEASLLLREPGAQPAVEIAVEVSRCA